MFQGLLLRIVPWTCAALLLSGCFTGGTSQVTSATGGGGSGGATLHEVANKAGQGSGGGGSGGGDDGSDAGDDGESEGALTSLRIGGPSGQPTDSGIIECDDACFVTGVNCSPQCAQLRLQKYPNTYYRDDSPLLEFRQQFIGDMLLQDMAQEIDPSELQIP